ncbi:uncharacterized protein [Miscanthus floridulus]|uniref:uncharacterized protein n=1 Tax=Miscanthus floridulus TaxID=154761 RepID=UPI00345A1BB4
MSLDSITFDRDKVLQYVQKAFTKYTKNDYIMFAYNSGGLAGDHWIVVVIIQKWNKVIYLDSNRSENHDFSVLKLLIDEAFARHTNKLKDRPQPLKHAFKYACLQQSSAKSSGWYAAHHLFLAMRKTNLEYSEEFEVLTTPINMLMIREKLARFLVEQVIEKKGEFHHDQ